MSLDKPDSIMNPGDESVRSVKRYGRDRRGFVLVLIIFAMVVMTIFAVASIRTGADARRSGWASRGSVDALYTAEGGLRTTLGNWPTTSIAAMNPGDSLNMGWQTLPNRATYRTVIHRVDLGGSNVAKLYRVIVQARTIPGVTGQSTVTETVGDISIAFPGFYAANGITMGGSGGISDGYDSRLGPYTASGAFYDGDLSTNGSISLNSSTIVKGDVTAGGTVTNTGGVSGSIIQNHTPPFPPMAVLDCPSGGWTPLSALPSPLPTGTTYDPVSGQLKVGGGHNLTINASPQYHFSSVILSGGSTLTINPNGGHVDMYVDQKFTTGGGGILNTGGKPTDISLNACNTAPANNTSYPWDLSGGSDGFYTVYAPDRDLTVGGGGQLFGSAVSKTLTVSGGSRLHFDNATGGVGGKALKTVPGTWAQYVK
jgi:hypothetical protein